MPRSTYISDGSSTRIKSGAGTLYAAIISPQNGSSIVFADTPNIGAVPNLGARNAVTSTLAYVGTYTATTPSHPDFNGTNFNNGLVVAATSSASVTVIWD